MFITRDMIINANAFSAKENLITIQLPPTFTRDLDVCQTIVFCIYKAKPDARHFMYGKCTRVSLMCRQVLRRLEATFKLGSKFYHSEIYTN